MLDTLLLKQEQLWIQFSHQKEQKFRRRSSSVHILHQRAAPREENSDWPSLLGCAECWTFEVSTVRGLNQIFSPVCVCARVFSVSSSSAAGSDSSFSLCLISSGAEMYFLLVCGSGEKQSWIFLLESSVAQQNNNKTTNQPVCGVTGDTVKELLFATLGFWEQTAHYFDLCCRRRVA